VNQALTLLGILEQGGTASISDSTFGLTALNLLLGQCRIRNLMVWSISNTTYALPSSAGSYAIGLGAAAPFNVLRPNFIERANILLAGPNALKTITYPLKVVKYDEWSQITDLNALAAIPELLYNDCGDPISNLWLWPIPRVSTATLLQLYAWAQLTDFATLIAAEDMPDGYGEAITNMLALRMAPAFGAVIAPTVLQVIQGVAEMAEQSLMALNAKTRNLMMAPPPGAQMPSGQQMPAPGRMA